MKKTYIQPSMKAYAVKATEILAGSNGTTSITGGSSNSTGGPTVAEGKGGFFDEDWD